MDRKEKIIEKLEVLKEVLSKDKYQEPIKEVATDYTPVVLGDTADLPREDWLEIRTHGLGGSDAAAIMNMSKWGSPSTVWAEKVGFIDPKPADNWFQLEAGHAMEPLVGKLFAEKTGFTLVEDTNMYAHPEYPWMIADLDFRATTPSGENVIVECKTTLPTNLDNWHNGVAGEDGRLPIHYEIQVRHYMAVMNVETAYVIVSWGFTADKACIVRVNRNLELERTIIEMERDFWMNYVIEDKEPQERFLNDLALKKFIRMTVPDADNSASPGILTDGDLEVVQKFLDLCQERDELKDEVDHLDRQINALKKELVGILGEKTSASLDREGETYFVSNKPRASRSTNYEALKNSYPEAYEACVKENSTRVLSVNKTKTKSRSEE